MTFVMTLGVAPGASEACTCMEGVDQMTLSEFVDSDVNDASEDTESAAAAPTPAQNAESIQQLTDRVEDLVERVETFVDDPRQQTTMESTGDRPRTTTVNRMFQ